MESNINFSTYLSRDIAKSASIPYELLRVVHRKIHARVYEVSTTDTRKL